MSVQLIAEVGSVHDGSFGNACRLIDAAAEAGADSVKFQMHIAEAETVPDAPSPSYFSAESRWDYFTRTSFSDEEWMKLREKAGEASLTFLCSPFSHEAVERLEAISVDGYKIASGEVTNVPLLEEVARTGKPVYLSSGMSDWNELDRAVATLKGVEKLTVVQCSSLYPCPPEKVGLNVMMQMKQRYGLPVGLSDHTMGIAAPLAAVTLGASVIEKHFTFSRLMYGSDAAHSLEPGEFRALARSIREVEAVLTNDVDKGDAGPYEDMKRIFEKSIVAARSMEEGDELKYEDIAFKKPGDGLPPWRYKDLVGRRLNRAISADEPLREDDLS